ncbi:MAG: SDR family NAD(P)-dependent oxidoreductase [Proteobacteria bacterium]|nr:SDR family NAD(P)-dependent oxidoreductase [Pseudomonadota bacterium]
MPPHSRKRAILITGASTGIGKEAARHLTEKGFSVFAGVRKEKDALLLTDQSGGSIKPVILDVTRKADILSAVNTIQNETGSSGLYGLVNNAGIPFGGPLEYMDIENIRMVMEVNLIGAISVTQACLPLLRKGHGRIVNISSISGRIALPFVGPYAASKFALEAFSDSLRVELRPFRIPVSVIEPGDVATPIWEKTASTINQAAKAFPETAYDIYGPIFNKINTITTHGIPAYLIAKKIEHTLSAKWPKARYVVGLDARVLILISFFPAIIRDWIISLFLPQYGQA